MAIGWSTVARSVAGALLLTACAVPEVAHYAPPPGLTAQEGVTILGSKGDTFFLQSQEYHAVWAVDGVPVDDPVYGWDRPLLLTANEPHRLKVVYDWGAVAGGTTFEIKGPPGSILVLQAEDVERQVQANMWLVDAASGQIVGQKQPVRLSYIALEQPVPPVVTPSPFAIDNMIIRNQVR
jgi:hypothetical protein